MICDQCGHDPCETLTFCRVCRDAELTPKILPKAHEGPIELLSKRQMIERFVPPLPPMERLPVATMWAADFVRSTNDHTRLVRFLKGRSVFEKALILEYLDGEKRS